LLVEQQLYMQDHPEIKQMLHDFVSSCLVHKPADVREHARTFFSKFQDDRMYIHFFDDHHYNRISHVTTLLSSCSNPDGALHIKPLHSVLPPQPSFSEQSSSSSALPSSDSHPIRQRPLVVCGPSGVGKGTLLKRLLEEYGHVFAPVVSHTSRGPRPVH
jgi:hypothetical protein